MKTLYVDISLLGHRVPYLKALAKSNTDSVALLPQKDERIHCKQIVMGSGYDKKRSLIKYIKWLAEIRKICRQEKIDIVHFLCGDTFYRLFGLGMQWIAKPIVITYHHMLFSKVRNVSLRRIFKHSKMGIVHTDHLLEQLNDIGIRNAVKIEYPVFAGEASMENHEAKRQLLIPEKVPSIVVLGGTQKYKGLDILLDALKKVNVPFWLHVTGVERHFTLDYIKENTRDYSGSVSYNMKRLSDEEYNCALAAADIIVLPYRYEFDGASGPMTEGVWNRKYIVGAEHGSMGSLIRKYKLGRTFKTEDPEDLARVLNEVLVSDLEWSPEAENFRKELTAEQFLSRYSEVYRSIR